MGTVDVASEKPKKKKKEKKEFKSPNTYVILMVVIAIVAVLTWFVPGGQYELDESGQAIAGTYQVMESNPQGIWDILVAPIIGMVGSETTDAAISISLFIMIFGAFLQMLDESSILKIALKKISDAFKNNMTVLITILVTVMAVLGTVMGAYEDAIVYAIMFIPIFLALGADTIVAIMIPILGTQAGCLASTVNPFSVGLASGIAGISPGEGLIFRVVLLIVMIALVSFIIARYAAMVKKHPERSLQFFRHEEDLKEFPMAEGDTKFTRPQAIGLVVMCAAIVVMIISLVPWTSLIPGFTLFDDLPVWIAGTPILSTIIGSDITPFGSWYFVELSMELLVFTIVTGFILGYKIDDTVDIVMRGCANLLPVALVVPLARGIQVIMDAGGITATILHFGEMTLSALPPAVFVVVALLFYFVLACFIPSSTGLAAATFSIMASLSTFAGVSIPLMVTIYSMALGLAKMITPCSIAVMTCTQAAHVGYGTWVKKAVPIVAILFVVCCVFLEVGLLIGQ